MQFLFADHTLDTDLRELRRGSEPIAVEPQVFDLLIYLVENRDRVVSKDDLIASVWGGRIVSDSTLSSRINAARKAIGDSGEDQRLIRTIARKGLRFVGAVRTQQNGAEPAPPSGTAPDDIHQQAAPGAAAAGSSRHRGASVHQHERRSGAGVFLRRHQRGHHHGAVQAAMVLRDRAQLVVRLQGQGRPHEAGRRRARRRLCGRRQRTQERRARAHHGAAQRRDHRQPHLGGALRPRPRRRVRGAGRDHRVDRRRDRAQALCGGKFSRPAQAAGQHGRLGPGDAGAVALLAGDAPGQRGGAGPAREGDRHRSELRPGAWASGHQPHVFRPHGLGGYGDGSAERRARRAGGDPCRRRGSLGALRVGLCLFVHAAL